MVSIIQTIWPNQIRLYFWTHINIVFIPHWNMSLRLFIPRWNVSICVFITHWNMCIRLLPWDTFISLCLSCQTEIQLTVIQLFLTVIFTAPQQYLLTTWLYPTCTLTLGLTRCSRIWPLCTWQVWRRNAPGDASLYVNWLDHDQHASVDVSYRGNADYRVMVVNLTRHNEHWWGGGVGDEVLSVDCDLSLE